MCSVCRWYHLFTLSLNINQTRKSRTRRSPARSYWQVRLNKSEWHFMLVDSACCYFPPNGEFRFHVQKLQAKQRGSQRALLSSQQCVVLATAVCCHNLALFADKKPRWGLTPVVGAASTFLITFLILCSSSVRLRIQLHGHSIKKKFKKTPQK